MYKKNHIKLYQNISCCFIKKIFEVNKKLILPAINREIQVITCMNMLIRSSESISNPLTYTDIIDYVGKL